MPRPDVPTVEEPAMRNRALVILACAFMGLAPFGARAEKADPAAAASSWSSPSLRSETVAGPRTARSRRVP